MSKGYIVIAQNTKKADYARMAYALALSIKATQKEVVDVCLCTDETTLSGMKDHMKAAFSHIKVVPETTSDWKIDNKWRYYDLTPFDETIILDADMVFTESIDHWWEFLSAKDFWACTSTMTFRKEKLHDPNNRIKFIDKQLPNIYTNMTYFKKSHISSYIFNMVKIIFHHWEDFYRKYLIGPGQTHMSADLAYALAIRLTDTEDEVCDYNSSFPTFVHMRNNAQNVNGIEMKWEDSIGCIMTDDLALKVGNYRQTLPFHYIHKAWLTDERLEQIENA